MYETMPETVPQTMPETMTESITPNVQRAERANKILGIVIGGFMVTIGGFVAMQNFDSVKLPNTNKMWADAWKKKLSKPMDLPEFKSENGIDWSDPKNDPNKLSEQPWAQESPLFRQYSSGRR